MAKGRLFNVQSCFRFGLLICIFAVSLLSQIALAETIDAQKTSTASPESGKSEDEGSAEKRAPGSLPDSVLPDSQEGKLLNALRNELAKGVADALKAGANASIIDKYGDSAVIVALRRGMEQSVVDLIASGAELDYGMEGWTPLHVASKMNSMKIVRALLKSGRAPVNAQTQDHSWTPLHLAAQAGHSSVVSELLKAGADWQILAGQNATAWTIAAQFGNVDTLKVMTSRVPSVEKASCSPDGTGRTAVHWAAALGRTAVLRYLMERKLSTGCLNAQTNSTAPPIMMAAAGGFTSVIQLLAKNGGNPQARANHGWSALHSAAEGAHKRTILHLIDEGCSVAWTAKGGVTPLHAAAGSTRANITSVAEAIDTLLQKGANLTAVTVSGHSVIDMCSLRGDGDCVEALLEAGIPVTGVSGGRYSPIVEASSGGHVSIIKMLINAGADPNAQSPLGLTPLVAVARGTGNTDAALELINSGADMNKAAKGGSTAFVDATIAGHNQLVTMLFLKGAKPNPLDAQGMPASVGAALHGHLNALELILRHGGSINETDPDGYHMLHALCESGKDDVLKIVLETSKKHWELSDSEMGTRKKDDGRSVNVRANYRLDVNVKDKSGVSPLHVCANAKHGKVPEMLGFLISAGANISAIDDKGRSVLFAAALSGNVRAVKLLLDKGATLGDASQESSSESPIVASCATEQAPDIIDLFVGRQDFDSHAQQFMLAMCASMCNSLAVSKLASMGVDVNTPLIPEAPSLALPAAACEDNGYTLDVLTKFGADCDVADSRGVTPLMVAAMYGRENIMHVLMAKGANPKAVDEQGRAARDYLREGGKVNSVLQTWLGVGAKEDL